MKAIVATKFGTADVLQLQEVKKPTPKANEILVKVMATTVSAGDIRMRSLNVPLAFWLPARLTLGFTKPKNPIYGMELAGEVAAVGPAVTRFKVGDEVFASTLAAKFGAYAEYKCLPEDGLVLTKPHNMTYEEAAAVPIGGPTAVRLLRKGNVQRGQKVLIYGASGSVGTYAVQVARHLGADVTAVCGAANVALVQSLGADRVLDYTQADFASKLERYDVIFDTVAKFPKAILPQALAPDGRYESIAKLNTKQYVEELSFIKGLIEAGEVRAVIDLCYPLEQAAEAHRYVEAGHKKGNVVLTMV